MVTRIIDFAFFPSNKSTISFYEYPAPLNIRHLIDIDNASNHPEPAPVSRKLSTLLGNRINFCVDAPPSLWYYRARTFK